MSKKDKKDKREEIDEEEEEVRIKKIRILGAIVGVIVAALFYVAFPYFMNNYFLNAESEYYWKLVLVKIPIFANMDFSNIEIDTKNLELLFDRWLYAGIPMVVLGMLTWAMPKGSRQRFLMSTIYLAGSIIWLLYVLNFGNLPELIRVTYDDNTFELGMILTFILYLMVLFRALKFLIIYGTYKDSREKYLDGE